MGYAEEYAKVKKLLGNEKPIWLPDKKVVVLPPRFLVWLAADDLQLCYVDASAHDFARYVVTRKAGKNVEISIATDEQIRAHRQELIKAGQQIVDKLPEPHRTRLSALLFSIS